jgi:hypothetical protein
MRVRPKVVEALRYLKENPRISDKGIDYIGTKLQEAEEEPGEIQAYLKSAFQYVQQKRDLKFAMSRNIRRLSASIQQRDRKGRFDVKR